MKRVVIDHFGGPEVLEVVEDADTRPGPGEVRVRREAALQALRVRSFASWRACQVFCVRQLVFGHR
jgi:hypothetical protein